MDGPIFGVLNVDANLNYDDLNVPRDTDRQGKDARIAALLDLMQTASLRLGQIFGFEFAKIVGGANDV